MRPKTLYRWYREQLSGYNQAKSEGLWAANKFASVSEQTGEIAYRPVYIAKAENMGEVMSIDDKHIGKDMFTIMTNQQTGKIAFMAESLKVEELKQAAAYLGTSVNKVKTICCDMSSSYLKFCQEVFAQSHQVIDKFHVIRHVLDGVQSVRIRLKNNLLESMPKNQRGRQMSSPEDNLALSDLELLKHTRYLLTQKQTLWNDYQQTMMTNLFLKFPELKTAYYLAQKFIQWFDRTQAGRHRIGIEAQLFKWYEEVEESAIKEMKAVAKMIERFEERILNYFEKAITNAKAERLNGQIQRFITQNYGFKDKDFALFRLGKYFS